MVFWSGILHRMTDIQQLLISIFSPLFYLILTLNFLILHLISKLFLNFQHLLIYIFLCIFFVLLNCLSLFSEIDHFVFKFGVELLVMICIGGQMRGELLKLFWDLLLLVGFFTIEIFGEVLEFLWEFVYRWCHSWYGLII